jgi:hypothetical protein
VTVDLGITVAASDADGSEASTEVLITFTGLPEGTVASAGTLDATAGTWSGTMAQANGLSLTLPGDYSGAITAEITALSPEGSLSTQQQITVTPVGDIDLPVAELVISETDAPVTVTPADAWHVEVSDLDTGLPRETIEMVTLTLDGMPAGVGIVGVPAATVSYDAATGGSFSFTGSLAQYEALQITFPTDYSTTSPAQPGGALSGTLTATSSEDSAGQSTPVTLRITAEGDVLIDDTLPDTVADETNAPTAMVPADLLRPTVTDIDGSESLQSLVLSIEGLPGGSDLASLGLTLPAGVVAQFTTAPDGSARLEITLEASSVGDVLTAYEGLALSLPADFSTTNRSDLTGGATSLPLTLTLTVQTDEDQDASSDTAVDGTATATRVVEIAATEDITLTAPRLLVAEEDGGAINSAQGVTVDLGLSIAITDRDGSETADTNDPRFAADVRILFSGLPPDAIASTGTLRGPIWSGSVEEAQELVLDLPGNYNGTINSLVIVITPEGFEVTQQTISVTPTGDAQIDGAVVTHETDGDVTVQVSDFVSILDTDPGETILSLSFTVTGLPAGTTTDATSAMLTADGTGTFTLSYDYPGDGTRPEDLTLTFPQDFSTENPLTLVTGELELVISDGSSTYTETATVPFTITAEGDVEVNDGAVALTESDAPITLRPADTITPMATDIDGSESITSILVALPAAPNGLRYTLDGSNYSTFPASGSISISETEFASLEFELPADFSTESPSQTLDVFVLAQTDEGGSAQGVLSVTVLAEGDLEIQGTGGLSLSENDAPGDLDEDITNPAPVTFALSDALSPVATDADGSEAIADIDIEVLGLPEGAAYSTDGGLTYQSVPAGGNLSLSGLSSAEYSALTIQLPDDFSTSADITGTVTAHTDEARLAGETDTGPNDGVETRDFTVTITPEADVRIDLADLTVIEDLGTDIPFGIAASVTDIDGSETITRVTVTFDGLPTNGPTTLTDGTLLTGPSASWSGTAAELAALGARSFPDHFSGIIEIGVTVVTNEGSAIGTTDRFQLNVTPVSEPTISLSVDASEADVIAPGGDQFVVDEDGSFLLLIDSETPDQDGSEALSQITIENLPVGWVAHSGGSVDLALFEEGAADVASANVSGTTLTIILQPGVTDFDGALRVTPLEHDDRDVATLTGDDLVATVISVDTATGLSTDTAGASDSVDVDVDAVVDTTTATATGATVDENTAESVSLNLDLNDLGLVDQDGSETFSEVELAFNIDTASDTFDPASELVLTSAPALATFFTITLIAADANSVTYRIEPATGATTQQFSDAIASLEMSFPQHFSGVVQIEGTGAWSETTTPGLHLGDVEYDTGNNFATGSLSVVHTINPVSEATLTASVFVVSSDEVADEITRVEASVENGTISGSQILTLLESTDDGSSDAGQVNLFVGIEGSTPDTDGSEELRTITIENVPTDWIADHLSGDTVDMSAFFSSDGSGPLDAASQALIDSATYDAMSGVLSITLVPDVTSFEAAIQLQPTLYEDYDVDRHDGDPFTALGDYFGADLTIHVATHDSNTATIGTQEASVELDVDVDPVNNLASVVAIQDATEQVIDEAGGVWTLTLEPAIGDVDGSETITALIFSAVPEGLTIYVTDLSNPTGPKIPALLTELGVPPGFNTWNLEPGQFEDIEVRGIPMHYAGTVVQDILVVTTEDDGGTRVTSISEALTVTPVADGGTPTETLQTQEDTAVQVVIDGNVIDNDSNSPLSPEELTGDVLIQNVAADSFGRLPRFFVGDPDSGGTELFLSGGELLLTAAQSQDLWVLPGSDSNEDITFDVTVTYVETIDPAETTTATGTVTIEVSGIADDPDTTIQNEDPTTTTGGIAQGDIDAMYRPDDLANGLANYNRAYGYAGYDSGPFLLDMRLTDEALELGFDSASTVFEAADTISGAATEIVVAAPDEQDGSETIYYLITGVPPGTTFIGANSVDAAGENYIVTEANLPNLMFVPNDVSEVTYYDLTFHTIVIEDDQLVDLPAGNSTHANLAYIDSLPGGAVVSEDFSIIVLPQGGSSPDPCPPEEQLPLPELSLVGGGDEDSEIALQLQLTPMPGYYDNIGDLASLPNGVDGDFTLVIDLPPGATLASDPPGAILLDPATGNYVVDIARLGVDPLDPTRTEGSILYTPPDHESSPVNPFDPDETLGPDDPYDNLSSLDFEIRLVNASCNTVDSGNGSFSITINPVVDGPHIVLGGADQFDEDTPYDLDLAIEAIDGGERLTGNVEIALSGDTGAELLDASGDPISGTLNSNGSTTYSISPDDISGLSLLPTQHLSGVITIEVSATTEDIDGSTLTNTVSRTIDVTPVTDTPIIDFDNTVIDAETGAPVVDDSGSAAVITIIEDQPFNLSSVVTATTPDQDGSEVVSITILDVPDYLVLRAPSRNGFIDNGDGSYTLSEAAFSRLTIELRDEHARTPDGLDATLPDSIPLRISVITLETANSETEETIASFSLVVRPDADLPTLTASIAPLTGIEDQAQPYEITLSATSPDPHETIDFRITSPDGGTVYLDGLVLAPDASGTVLIPGGGGPDFAPTGTVTFVPEGDFGGTAALDVVAVTSDTSVDGSFTDTETSAVTTLTLDISEAPDLVLTVDDVVVDLDETDAAVSFYPAGGFTIDVTDVDGSESVDGVTYTISGVPEGTSYSVSGGAPVSVSGDLVFTGSLAEFQTLTVTFPTDFASNGVPLSGTLNVTTTEGGDEVGTFSIEIDGELDLSVSNTTPISLAQDGSPLVVNFEIAADVSDVQSAPSEWLEEVVITFDTAVPVSTIASNGAFDASRQTLTFSRGAMDPASFAAAVAALSITLPETYSGVLQGSIVVESNHGTAAPQDVVIDVNDQPVVTGPITFETNDTTFTVDFATLLANASDSDGLSVANPISSDPDVFVTLLADAVEITVPVGYVGTPVLTYDVVDDAAVPAFTQGTAELTINTLQMEDSGSVASGNPLMTNVSGGSGRSDIALATDTADSVIYDAIDRPYTQIEGFSLLGGDDFIDLSGGGFGYSIDGGSGADRIIGSTGANVIIGGTGADTLTGGAGNDVFTMTDLSATDVITDYESPALLPGAHDQFDLTALVQLASGEVLSDQVAYDSTTGALVVDGNQIALVATGSGFAPQIEVIFEDAANTQQSAVI